MTHPLLSDFHPKGAVAQQYGVYNEVTGFPRRAVFIIDKKGIIRYSRVYATGLPNVDEVLTELEKVTKE